MFLFPGLRCCLPGATWCQELMCHTLHSHWHFHICASNHQVKWSCSCTSQSHMWCSRFSLWSWDIRLFWVPRKQFPFSKLWWNWYTLKLLLEPPSRLTTPLPMTSSQPKFAWSVIKHSTCTTTGSKIGLHKASLIFSGLVANKIMETTSLNTILRLSICWCTHYTYTQQTVYLTCEGVLVFIYPTHCRPQLHVITHQAIFPPVKT